MKIIYNKLIPFPGYKILNFFGILFTRSAQLSEEDVQHEQIHTAQMKELLYIFFYIIYVIEWLILLFKYGKKAYRNISFEKEAYANQNVAGYLQIRKHYAQWY